MKIVRTLFIVLLFALVVMPVGMYAQDDMDLESLLSDLSDEAEPTASAAPAPLEEPSPEKEADLFMDDLAATESAPSAVATETELETMGAEQQAQPAVTDELLADISQPQQPASEQAPDAGALNEQDVLDVELLLLEGETAGADLLEGQGPAAIAEDSAPAPTPEPVAEASVDDLLAGADADMADLLGDQPATDPVQEQEPVIQPDIPMADLGTDAASEVGTVPAEDIETGTAEGVTEEVVVIEEESLVSDDTDALLAETDLEVPVETSEFAQKESTRADDVAVNAPETKNVTADKAAPDVKAYSQTEEVRRQALEIEGRKNLQEAFSAYDRAQYEEAIKNFEMALEKIPERPATVEDRKRATWGHAEADYRLALAYYKEDKPDLKKAEKHINSALNYMPENRAAQSLKNKISKAQERAAYQQSLPVPAKETPEYVAKEKDIKDLLREGRDYYGVGDYNRAEALFSRALVVDQYNTTAMRYLRKIAEKRKSISDVNFEATKAKAIAAVRETWTPPIMEEVVLPEKIEKGAAIEKLTDAERLRERMASIIIPKIEFRDANIQDVVDFLAEASQAADPNQQGVNIVLHLKGSGESRAAAPAAAQPAQQDDFGFDDFDVDEVFNESAAAQPAGRPAPSSGIALTLNLRRISLLDAIKTITEIAGMRYRIDGNIVIISPQGYVTGQVVTRMYPVQPTILDVIVQREVSTEDRDSDFIEMGGKTTMERSDVKDFFEKAGVPFPQGTSITYNPGISQLIVANTPENLEIFERILAQLNVIPNQVEIEARFIEISEDNLRELGLEWILNDNWEIATKKAGSGSVSSAERVQVNENGNGFTEGLRFFGYSGETGSISPQSAVTSTGSALGNILSVSSILTNPEMTVVLHALDQSGGTDLLSAPRVTARSGYNATIQVVREIIYPTEFDAQSQSVGTGAGESSDKTVVVVTPGSFETREVGVILNVTPTVGPDGYTIDLAMVPEVSELIGWIEYGSAMGDITYHMPQPIFSSRNVTTSIVIWDGQTVVMGGMIREELTTMNDKIPLLGDIPLLGRLFRSEGEYSQKKNLLIFVTARLVDPAGKPIHKRDGNVGGMPGAVTAEEPTEQI